MSISYVLDPARKWVITTVAGQVSAQEILDHLEAARREKVLSWREKIDARGVTTASLSTKDIWETATQVGKTPGLGRCGPRAVIVTDVLMFGLTRTFATLVSDHFPMAVFDDPQKAEEWLDAWRGPVDAG